MEQHDQTRAMPAPQGPSVRAVAAGASPVERRSRAAVIACTLALTASLAAPQAALAGWPLDAAAPVALGFGATYVDPDGMATHRGVDLAADEGSTVRAPIAGRVSFVGRVPAREGGSMLAATVEGEGCSITLLPLSSARVEAGAELAQGDAVGELAKSGDDSSEGTHLHVGARRGSLYIDPLSLISAPPAPAEKTPELPPAVPAEQGVPTAAGAHAGAGAPAAVAGSPGAAVEPAPVTPAGAMVVTPGDVTVAAAPVAAPVPGGALAPGVSLADAERVRASSALDAAAEEFSAGLERACGAAGEGASLGGLSAWVREAASRGLWAGARLLVAILSALGALWPMWRRERGKGANQLSVRPTDDDVAAVAGQW